MAFSEDIRMVRKRIERGENVTHEKEGGGNQYCPLIMPGIPAWPSHVAGMLCGMLLSFSRSGFGPSFIVSQETRKRAPAATNPPRKIRTFFIS